ncbi:MAG: polysaccharide biosynthesis protein [bacterium P201]|nr:MAG: polysaccharide biosynthesis protein [bacterium P201]
MSYLNKIANWYFSRKALPLWGILLIDNLIVFVTFVFMYLFFDTNERSFSHIGHVSLNILVYLVFYNVAFRIFRTFSGILRYSSFVDLQRVGYAMMLGSVLSYIFYRIMAALHVGGMLNISGRQLVATMIGGTLALWVLRMGVKMLYDILFASQRGKRTYIFGVKHDGIAIAKHIRSEKPMRFNLKGFATVEKEMDGHVLMGMKVRMADSNLVERMKAENIEALIVSPYRLVEFRNRQDLQDELIRAGVHIYVTQGTKELDNTDQAQPEMLPDLDTAPQLREISIEDLLPRDEILVNMKEVGQQLKGRCIMITGSAGSIGSEMVRQIAVYKPSKMVLVDQAETPQHDIRLMMNSRWPNTEAHVIVASICERDHMETLFHLYRPEYVFHAAAYKHVPMMEDNPSESVRNNIIGTRVIADLAVKYGVKKFVMISTDKAVNPTNVMGCSKRICEIYVQSLDKAIKDGKVEGQTQFVTTRFGNVLGSNGSVIPLFKEQIKKGGPVTVTDPNIIRYFMLIPEACKLVLEAGTRGKGGEIFVFDMGKPVKIADLAERMIRLSGAKNVEIKFTGLRPGEKLYEEVLNEEETTKPSFHEKIRIAMVREYDYDDVCREIDQLYAISKQFADMDTVAKMKAIVPEYKSNNSIYSKLDQ